MTRASLNRRQASRAPVSIAVKKRVGKRTTLCQASDISTNGMFIASIFDELHPHDSRCLLEFTLPGSKITISARGRVVRQTKNGRYHLMAVRFAAIAPSHRRIILRYVRGPAAVSRPVFLQSA